MKYRTQISRTAIDLNPFREGCSHQGIQISEATGVMKHGNEKGVENGEAHLKTWINQLYSNPFFPLTPKTKISCFFPVVQFTPQSWFFWSKKLKQHQSMWDCYSRTKVPHLVICILRMEPLASKRRRMCKSKGSTTHMEKIWRYHHKDKAIFKSSWLFWMY